MTVTHVRATKKYVAGWETIFSKGGKKKDSQKPATQAAKSATRSKKKAAPASKKKAAGKKTKR